MTKQTGKNEMPKIKKLSEQLQKPAVHGVIDPLKKVKPIKA
jgi:hypothetical protein